MGVTQDGDGKGQQENNVSRLEIGVERTNRLMVALTALMSAATIGGALVAYFQWKTAEIQFRQDQRPYVISVAAPRQLAPNQLIMVDFRNGNYGKSPAIKAGGAGKIFFGDDAMQRADRWFKDEAPHLVARRNETILPPNTPATHIEARRTTLISERPVSDVEFDALMRKDFSIVAVMRQAYLDTTGKEYWTDSCVSNLASRGSNEMAIVECNSHNHIE